MFPFQKLTSPFLKNNLLHIASLALFQECNRFFQFVFFCLEEPIEKSISAIKQELTEKGFKTFDFIDEETHDTILMQQYFMAFLKTGPIRGQNEEETADLQKEHLAHLKKMYDLGYADISGPFGDNGSIRGITIYNPKNG